MFGTWWFFFSKGVWSVPDKLASLTRRAGTERFPDHRHRNLKAFEELIQTHVLYIYIYIYIYIYTYIYIHSIIKCNIIYHIVAWHNILIITVLCHCSATCIELFRVRSRVGLETAQGSSRSRRRQWVFSYNDMSKLHVCVYVYV